MGSLKRRSKGGNWYAQYTDGSGKLIRKSTGTTNKQNAARILKQWEEEANLLQHGLASKTLTLETVLQDYLASIAGNGDDYVSLTESRLRRIINACRWKLPRDIQQYQAEAAVQQLTDKRNDKPVSKRTQSHYLGALKSFTKWLTHTRRVLNRDPLIAVKKPNFDRDRKLVRRYLLHEEWEWLKQTDNALTYEVAIQTGYRVSELAELTPDHLGDDFLALPGKYTKNGLDAKQYITADLARKLEGRLPLELPWDGAVYRTADMLRRDLEQARAKYEEATRQPDKWLLMANNAHNHALDFHALRHTCGAWLALAGVQPKVIQSVMRHSSITLTMDTYGHMFPGAEKDAIQHFKGM